VKYPSSRRSWNRNRNSEKRECACMSKKEGEEKKKKNKKKKNKKKKMEDSACIYIRKQPESYTPNMPYLCVLCCKSNRVSDRTRVVHM
jgi:hypothetical protein